jgi:hypothetical protein
VTEATVDHYITGLTEDLRPVGRLRSPWIRALGWLALVAAAAAVLAWFSDLGDVVYRLRFVPDMWMAVLGSTLTTVLGAVATFQLSLPDRSERWALLPLPGLALWIAASGMGCFRAWVIPDMHAADLMETRDCFVFILGLSVPLSIVTILMVRQAFPMRPDLTAATGGIAVAAAAATLLNFFHPYDAGVTDIAVHVVAVGVVIAANRTIGGRLLTRKSVLLPRA